MTKTAHTKYLAFKDLQVSIFWAESRRVSASSFPGNDVSQRKFIEEGLNLLVRLKMFTNYDDLTSAKWLVIHFEA